MTMGRMGMLLTAGAALASISACNKASAPAASNSTGATAMTNSDGAQTTPNDAIASAEAAAPASIAHGASIVSMDANGGATVLRKGTNGWTCIPDSPATPGPDAMCADGNAMKWADAWIHHKTPPTNTVGVMYMLAGGTDASNTDPYATQPTADNDWVKTGPHIMVVGSKDVLAGYPTGAKPDTSAPYVMWAGTPYAHLMVPITKGG